MPFLASSILGSEEEDELNRALGNTTGLDASAGNPFMNIDGEEWEWDPVTLSYKKRELPQPTPAPAYEAPPIGQQTPRVGEAQFEDGSWGVPNPGPDNLFYPDAPLDSSQVRDTRFTGMQASPPGAEPVPSALPPAYNLLGDQAPIFTPPTTEEEAAAMDAGNAREANYAGGFEGVYGVPPTPENIRLLQEEGVYNSGLSAGELQRRGGGLEFTSDPTARQAILEQFGAGHLGVDQTPVEGSFGIWNYNVPGMSAVRNAVGDAVGGTFGAFGSGLAPSPPQARGPTSTAQTFEDVGRFLGESAVPVSVGEFALEAAGGFLPADEIARGAVKLGQQALDAAPDVGRVLPNVTLDPAVAAGRGGMGAGGADEFIDAVTPPATGNAPPLRMGDDVASTETPVAATTPTTPIDNAPNPSTIDAQPGNPSPESLAASQGGRGDDLPPTNPPSPPEPPSGAVPPTPPPTPDDIAKKLTDAVKTARRLTPEQQAARSAELSRRTGGFARVMEGATTADEAMRARGMLRGEMPRAQFTPPILEPAEWDQLFVNVARTDKLPPLSRNGALDALADLRSGLIPQPAALEKLARIYPDLAQVVSSKRPLAPKVWDEIIGLLGIPQAAQTFLDASGTLRQALVLGLGNPNDFWHAVRRQAGVLGAKPGQAGSRAKAAADELMANPWINGRDHPGLSFEEVGGHTYSTNRMVEAGDKAGGFTSLNQSKVSRFVQAVPGMARSQEGMITLLNDLGQRVYAREAQNLWDMGVRDPEQFKGLAAVINHARGFGSFRAPDLVKGVNAFYSPRFLSSRVELFTDPFTQFAKGNTAAGKLAAKNLVSFVGTNVALLELLNQTGVVEVGWNPLDTDFGKAKVGNIRIDPWAGVSPLARLVARSGAIAANELGIKTGYKHEGGVTDLVKDFLGGKLGPIPQNLAEQLGITERFPDDPKLLSAEKLFETFTPFLVQSIRESIEQGGMGWKGALIAAPLSALGAGTLAYPPSPTEQVQTDTPLAIDAALAAGAIPPEVGESLRGLDYFDLTGKERKAIAPHLDPADLAAREEAARRNGSVFQSTRDEVDAYWEDAAKDMDELMMALFKGGVEPKKILERVKEIKAGDDHFYETQEYKDAVASLPESDIQKLIEEYFSVPDKVSVGGVVDWNKARQVQAAMLREVAASDPALGERLAWNVQKSRDPNAHDLIQLLDESAPLISEYYSQPEGAAREQWRRDNPKGDFTLWLLGYNTSVRSQVAAEIASKVTQRQVRLIQ